MSTISLVAATGASFAIVKIIFQGLSLLVGEEGDALLRKRVVEFHEQIDQSTLGEAIWWLASTGLARVRNRVHDPLAAGLLMFAACVFLNSAAIVLATSLLLKDDPDYVNSATFMPLARDVLFEFFHAQSFVTTAATLSGAVVTWLASILIWRFLGQIQQDRFVRQLIGRLAASMVVALAAGCVPFLLLRWLVVLQVHVGIYSEFASHLTYVLAVSGDATKVLGFALVASAAAALPAVLMSAGMLIALYLYTSPPFLRDATIRLIQAVARGKTDIVNQVGNFAGALAAVCAALVTLLSR
jgi:hypothetical protein